MMTDRKEPDFSPKSNFDHKSHSSFTSLSGFCTLASKRRHRSAETHTNSSKTENLYRKVTSSNGQSLSICERQCVTRMCSGYLKCKPLLLNRESLQRRKKGRKISLVVAVFVLLTMGISAALFHADAFYLQCAENENAGKILLIFPAFLVFWFRKVRSSLRLFRRGRAYRPALSRYRACQSS